MEYTQKASVGRKTKNRSMLLICITASVSLLGIVMAVYSMVRLKLVFALIYVIAAALGLIYAVMRINTVVPPYIAEKDGYLYLQTWKGLFPFRTDKGFIGEYIPEKTILKKINISQINRIYLGTRNYLVKLLPEGKFADELAESKKKYESIVKRMDFIYISTRDGNEVFMSVTDFDDAELADILKHIVDSDERIDFKCNNRVISKSIPPKRLSF